MRVRKKFILLIASISLMALGCTTTKLPICTKLSKTKPSAIDGISKTLYNVCTERSIEITVLSSTVAEFKGSNKQIRWLQSNYFIIICDFEQERMIDDKAIYLTCMSNAENWIRIIQSRNPETLMNDSTHFCDVCCE